MQYLHRCLKTIDPLFETKESFVWEPKLRQNWWFTKINLAIKDSICANKKGCSEYTLHYIHITYASTVTIGTQGKSTMDQRKVHSKHASIGTTSLSDIVKTKLTPGSLTRVNHSIKWSVVSKSHTYVCGSNWCDLCLTEKLIIARSNHQVMLNKSTYVKL